MARLQTLLECSPLLVVVGLDLGYFRARPVVRRRRRSFAAPIGDRLAHVVLVEMPLCSMAPRRPCRSARPSEQREETEVSIRAPRRGGCIDPTLGVLTAAEHAKQVEPSARALGWRAQAHSAITTEWGKDIQHVDQFSRRGCPDVDLADGFDVSLPRPTSGLASLLSGDASALPSPAFSSSLSPDLFPALGRLFGRSRPPTLPPTLHMPLVRSMVRRSPLMTWAPWVLTTSPISVTVLVRVSKMPVSPVAV